MKMKKERTAAKKHLLLVLAMALAFGMAFTACSSSNSSNVDQRIIGTWDSQEFAGEWVTFTAQGTVTGNLDGSFTGTFSTSNGRLTLSPWGKRITVDYSFPNNNTLRIVWDYDEIEHFARRG